MDELSIKAVKAALRHPLTVQVYPTIDSTNSQAKRLVAEGKPGNLLLLAEEQTGGRGRLGRTFYSPAKTGIYLSLVLRGVPLSDGMLLTTAAAVAVAQAVEEALGCRLSIKWVNDLFLENRKVAGILTEALPDGVVIGIGVNTAPSAFPRAIRDLAGFVPLGSIPRAVLAAAIVDRLLDLASRLPDREFLTDYRARSMVLGRPIRCFRGESVFDATAVDVDQNGGLIIRLPDGTEETLSTGEVTIRPLSEQPTEKGESTDVS